MDPHNPYMPPAEAAGPAEPLVGPEPTTGVRFLTFLVDQFAVAATASGVVLIMTVLGSNVMLTNPSLGGIASWLFGPAYYVVFEAATGRTLGKLLLGTRVVNLNGGSPSLGQIVGRTLCRYIPFEPFSFLFGNTGWHDRISNTRVVRVRRGTSP